MRWTGRSVRFAVIICLPIGFMVGSGDRQSALPTSDRHLALRVGSLEAFERFSSGKTVGKAEPQTTHHQAEVRCGRGSRL